jgi:hypothetical protein
MKIRSFRKLITTALQLAWYLRKKTTVPKQQSMMVVTLALFQDCSYAWQRASSTFHSLTLIDYSQAHNYQ